MNVKVLSYMEAIDCLSENNLSINDNDESLSIPSNSAFVYSLKNNEILILPSDLEHSVYPALLFESKKAFLKSCKEEDFPIPDSYLTWLERNINEVKEFASNNNSKKAFADNLNVNLPFKNRDDIYNAYQQVCKLLKNKKLTNDEIDEITYSYAFEIMKYFVDNRDYSYELLKQNNMYNPYYYPILKTKEGKEIDIISMLFGSLEVKSENAFLVFYRFANDNNQ